MKHSTYMSYVVIFCTAITLPLNGMQPFKVVYRWGDIAFANIFRRHETPVYMNDAKTIALAPTIQKSMEISTTGLIGCSSTVTYMRDKKGYKYAIVTHYSDNNVDHIPALKDQIRAIDAQDLEFVRFFTIMPIESPSYHEKGHQKFIDIMRNDLVNTVQENVACSTLDINHIDYMLPPMHRFDKTNVYVTLSNNKAPRSQCNVSNWANSSNIALE